MMEVGWGTVGAQEKKGGRERGYLQVLAPRIGKGD